MAQPPELHEFDNPPVSEVAISVEISPFANWHPSAPAKFWLSLKDEYPNFQAQPPVVSLPEHFDRPNWAPASIAFSVSGDSTNAQRYWLETEPVAWLVQLQRDRFSINWRKASHVETYPRYIASMRPRFSREWERFTTFLRENEIGDVNVKRCEVTYVNDIPKDEGWRTLREAMLLLSPFREMMPFKFLPQFETFRFQGSFSFPDAPGRLHFAINHLLRQTDGKEVLQLTLTARANPQSSEEVDLLSCIDQCRSWIVRGFTELTSEHAHTLWGRTK